MNKYVVITAMINGSLKTGLVDEDVFEGSAADFFPPNAEDVCSHGTVEISGEAEHMIPDYVVEG